MPSSFDIHQDHAVINQESKRAFRDSCMLGYEFMWNNFSFDTTAFVIISEKHIQAKINAFANQLIPFKTKAKSLIGVARDAVTKALETSSNALQKITQDMTKTLSSMTSNASDKGVEILNSVSEDLTQLLTHLEVELGQTYISGQESLREVMVQARTIPTEFGDFTKTKIYSTVDIVEGVNRDLNDWKEEVSNFMEVESQSVTSQLDQVATTDANYIEVLKNTLTSHTEKLNVMTSEEYHQIQGIRLKTPVKKGKRVELLYTTYCPKCKEQFHIDH